MVHEVLGFKRAGISLRFAPTSQNIEQTMRRGVEPAELHLRHTDTQSMKSILPHSRSLIVSLSILSLAAVGFPYRAFAADAPIGLPQYTVVGKFSDLECAARFRFHIPGANLKALVIRSTPASWKKLGIAPGDLIVAVDGEPVDGQGLLQLCRKIDEKYHGIKGNRFDLDLDIRKKEAGGPIQIRAEFDKDSDHFTIVYP